MRKGTLGRFSLKKQPKIKQTRKKYCEEALAVHRAGSGVVREDRGLSGKVFREKRRHKAKLQETLKESPKQAPQSEPISWETPEEACIQPAETRL